MTRLHAILHALNGRKARLLDLAQAALPEGQFAAFRKLVLNELGKQGFEQELERIMAKGSEQEGNGQGRPIHARKEVRYE
jgi:hypothetical protein